jgi:heme-degrading monooxygenase HmoA
MFVRNVSIHLKPNTLTEYSKIFETEILPFLRKQNGFSDEITFAGDNDYVNAISLWDSKQSAETYEKSSYPQVLKMLEKVLQGTPKVSAANVLHSTFQGSATAHVAA